VRSLQLPLGDLPEEPLQSNVPSSWVACEVQKSVLISCQFSLFCGTGRRNSRANTR
jgi:hypothetical protein